MKQVIKALVIIPVVLVGLLACSKDDEKPGVVEKLSASTVLEWNEIAFNAFGGPAYQHSLMASRINAMTHIAMHDALNAIQPKYETYAFDGNDTEADPVAAAASAAHTVLLNLIPDKQAYLDSALSVTLANVSPGQSKQRGIDLGRLAALAILSARANDGSMGDVVGIIPPSDEPGVYQAVPPFTFVFAPHWENVKPFTLQSKNQFRSKPFPALNSARYTQDFNEIKAAGSKNSNTRTADQTFYAQFWYEFSEAGWNRVARVATQVKQLNLLEAARLFALVDMAIADAYIAGWDSKFHYNLWRPYTAIRNGNNDGNDNTIGDPQWEPAQPTPPVQDYPSTHSALGNAAAVVLAKLLGDNTPFTMTSFTAVPAGSTRSFKSFSEAAYENADSRVRAGIHFRFACEAGLELGEMVGKWTAEKFLKRRE